MKEWESQEKYLIKIFCVKIKRIFHFHTTTYQNAGIKLKVPTKSAIMVIRRDAHAANKIKAMIVVLAPAWLYVEMASLQVRKHVIIKDN